MLYIRACLREILSIKSQDIDIHGGVIAIPQGKTGQRSAYLSKIIEYILLKRMQNNSQTQHIFLSAKDKPFSGDWVSKLFIEIITDMGFNNNVTDSSQRVAFHTLRHTFCSWLATQGIPLFTIGELVDHKTPTMTQRYAKLSPDSKRVALDILGQKKRGILERAFRRNTKMGLLFEVADNSADYFYKYYKNIRSHIWTITVTLYS